MPGGLMGVRDVVERCHKLGVRAFIVYKPWDIGTRRESISDVEALGSLVREVGADGVYLDTMGEAPPGLRVELDEIGPGLVMETEGALPIAHVFDHHMSWAQYFEDGVVPGILRNKWFERRHMMHQTARWRLSKIGQLHTAWMNGVGMVVWENVFGSWVGWSERDCSLLRIMLPIQRRYSDLFCGEEWTPLVPTERPDVYATLWEGANVSLWTLVNRTDQRIKQPLLKVSPNTTSEYFDLIAGKKLDPIIHNGETYLQGDIEPHGIGCFLAGTSKALGSDFPRFLAIQRSMADKRVASTDFPRRPVRLRPQPITSGRLEVGTLSGMVKVPSAVVTMRVQYRARECGFYGNEMDQDELYANFHKPLWSERRVTLPSYAMDMTLVTNSQYARFLLDSRYLPQNPENFLKHWSQGKPPMGKEDHPVVFVSLEDARAYASWIGKALPTEEQWQYAAQGPEALKFPWGGSMEDDLCNTGQTGTTTSVTAFRRGRSPFGCYDMCGNVWEWTESERTDGRTRFCIIRGGSYYTAEGSVWYMDGGPQPTDFAAKFLLMWPGLDRCATIGFRCVVSA
jgi:formylglycine-generating enzyme required for sulfatase activity